MDKYSKKLASAIGERVAKRRNKVGMTQSELAAKLKISDAHVSYIERGERGPSLVMLHKMARVLGTSVGNLVPMDI